MKFSLIMATIRRTEEPFRFLDSLKGQIYNDFEVIVIDQNSDDRISKNIQSYKAELPGLIHLKVLPQSLSAARNAGLKVATGDVVAFPDDDCRYFPDTLQAVNQLLSENEMLAGVKGRIVDENGGDSLKKWSKKPFTIKRRHILLLTSSITMFIKRNRMVGFDEQLGAGARFGACEDVDLMYRILSSGASMAYMPLIKVYHPHEDISDLQSDKIRSYGQGFGAYIRKHPSVVNVSFFIAFMCYHVLRGMVSLLKGDVATMSKRFLYVCSRIEGFVKYGG
ncbi:glycosyltransferase family 2 protein [Alkaliflexus imshenetskii]|uniref:glycosyltransferase family 2 protein n=1 Tax=Alkaliflexus imshenetskii TaxID=286730 RepID=UPI000479C944|nr:glycosyltransferase family 2 protein [Alkaliflexus imshenetskii]